MPIAEDSAGGSPVPIPTNLTTNLTGEATGSGTLDYTTGDIDIAVTVVDNGHNHILENITDVQVNNAISGQILVYNGTVWANATNTSGITAIVQDLTPQLGGNLDLNNRNITGTGNIAITGTIDGRDVSADGTKLDGIESGATADQTAAQIKTAYESNANTNNFADADVSKLSGIEPAADVTDTTNVVASLTAGTNVTISAGGVISSTASGGLAHVVDDTTPELGGNLSLNSHDITGTGNLNFTGNVTLSGTVDGRDVAADGTKLDGIEASADVTDTANVTAAGALMDSEVTNLAQVKAFDSSDYATAAQGTTADAALPKAGGTMTGDILFNDGVKAKYGTSSDLQIFHDASNSYIKEGGTGNLFIDATSLRLRTGAGTETYLTADGNNSVDLYYDNVKKFATTSQGILVTYATNISMDGDAHGQIKVHGHGYGFGIALDADAANLYTNSPTKDLVFGVDETEVARVTTTGIDVTGDIDISGAGTRRLDISNTTLADTGEMATLQWDNSANLTIQGRTSAGGFAANWYSIQTTDTDGRADAHIFYTDASIERMRIDSGGIDVTGTVTADKMEVQGTSGTRQWLAGSSTNYKEIYAYDNSTFYDRLNSGNCTNYQWGVYNNIPIYTITNNTVKTTLLGNGNFGVGLTAPTAKMHLFTDGIDQSMFAAQADLGVQNRILTLKSPVSDSGSAPYRWQTSNSIQWEIDSTETKSMLLNSAGNLGVGTYSPTAKLSVAGDILLDSDNAEINLKSGITGTSGAVNWTFNTTTTNYASLNLNYDTRATTGFHIDSGYPITIDSSGIGTRFAYGGTEQMRIANSGNVGIGTTTCADKLHVEGNVYLGISSRSVYTGGGGDLRLQTNTGEVKLLTANGATTNLITSGTGINIPNNLDVGGDIDATGTISSGAMVIENSGGYGNIEIGGGSGAYIDLKAPFSDDYDFRIITVGTSTTMNGESGNLILQRAGSSKLTVTTTGVDVTGDLTVSSTIEVGSLTPAQDGAIEVGVLAYNTPAIASTTDSTLIRSHIIFDNPNGVVGKINTLGSGTSYVTSSDYRLKTDVQAMTGSIDRLKALRPVNFEWIVDGTRIDGFLAHEAQEVVPEAVDGEKDAMRDQQYVESEATGDIYTPAVDATYETIQVELTPAVEATYDEDGNELTPAVDATYEEQQQELTSAIDEVIHSTDVVEPDTLEEGQLWRETTEKVMATRQVPDYQGIDQSKIVPLLTSALQDAIAKIEALETRLEALES